MMNERRSLGFFSSSTGGAPIGEVGISDSTPSLCAMAIWRVLELETVNNAGPNAPSIDG